ncbi:MAG: hypothetical protein K2X03_12340 [Bryobacteraceae bacterium]|nr:hypothetical protein [Bryobacteraceae bacterium]
MKKEALILPTNIQDELARESERRLLEVARYADTMLIDGVHAKRVLPNSPRLTRPEIDELLDGLAEFSDKIPHLPDSAFTREAIYTDHD